MKSSERRLTIKLHSEYTTFTCCLSKNSILKNIGKIAAMRDIYEHIAKCDVQNESACAYLLTLESPLEVLSDYWLECDKCIGDSIDHTVWAVCDRNIMDEPKPQTYDQNKRLNGGSTL